MRTKIVKNKKTIWDSLEWLKQKLNNKRFAAGIMLSILLFSTFAPSIQAHKFHYDLQNLRYQLQYESPFSLNKIAEAATNNLDRFNPWGENALSLPKHDDRNNAFQTRNQKMNRPEEYGIVAILVEEEILNNNSDYQGLRGDSRYRSNLNETTLPQRIQRYAENIQGLIERADVGLPYSKSQIIRIKPEDTTEDISAMLERLYLEGDGSTSNTALIGLVIVGDIPLPVVDKSGNKYVSMFPYTDFDDPYFILDQNTRDFVVNPNNVTPAAEVWHGVIKAPVSGEEGNRLLAEYFDKNHLFHLGEEDFTDFEKKFFYADLEKEYSLMSVDLWGAYEEYLKYWEDVAYLRYNKHWAGELFEASEFGKPEGDGIDNDGDGRVDEDPVNGYDDDGDAEPGSPLMGIADLKDNDGDGEIDEDDEGVWGICSEVPESGPVELENCKRSDAPAKTGDFYNVVEGSKYFVSDGIDNNADGLIDEGIDEDPGDAFIGIDNDRDGRIDEDTSADNDADGDKKIDEDGPGDMNGDGCPGQCGVDEDNDSIDADTDFWPTGYEKEKGTLDLSVFQLKNLISGEGFNLENPTDPEGFFSRPWIRLTTPFGLIWIPRVFPWPKASDWVDEGSISDDDEDGLIDEDGVVDNDNDRDGLIDEDPGDAIKDAAGGLDTEDVYSAIPDIKTKETIDTFLRNYSDLFDKFFAEINVWVDGT
ncbi:hypothetical protein GF376_01880, partial [Candidatus Peregrinibacteria bacterium]|nr:hypothetical protein [Candidatus Peregrinibacteria bacterium]